MTRVLPEVPLVLNPLTPEARASVGFKWAGPTAGRRSKIGGAPDWIQTPSIPICTCGNPITFYAQVDSVGDSIVLADVGMIYVFVCFDCLETYSVLQSS
jgi:uncharacterized protein YwqG